MRQYLCFFCNLIVLIFISFITFAQFKKVHKYIHKQDKEGDTQVSGGPGRNVGKKGNQHTDKRQNRRDLQCQFAN